MCSYNRGYPGAGPGREAPALLQWVCCVRLRGVLCQPPGAGGAAVLVVREGRVWDADRAASAAGVQPGQDVAATRTLLAQAEHRAFDPVRAGAALRPAWDLLAEACSTVEPDGSGHPLAHLAWRTASAPLPELRALRAAGRERLPHVALAIGLGTNRLIAGAACPPGGGFGVVARDGEAAFLAPRPLEDLVEQGLLAPALHHRLQGLGLGRCGQVAALAEAAVRARFGRDGVRIRELCLGRDERPVAALYPPRSVRRRASFPDGLPAPAWAAAAADLGRGAAAGLPAGTGACSLSLRGAFGEVARTWPAPQSAAAVLGRAAGVLAAGAIAGGARRTESLEVCLEAIAPLPVTPLPLLPPRLGSSGPRRQGLEDLLARLPRGSLHRGNPPSAYERLIAMLDPWRDAREQRGR